MNAEIKIDTYDLEEIERTVIVRCVEENKDASSKRLALLLNISERTLFRRMNKYKISLQENKKIASSLRSSQ